MNISGHCIDAQYATDHGYERSAARLHISCRMPATCQCQCHRKDQP